MFAKPFNIVFALLTVLGLALGGWLVAERLAHRAGPSAIAGPATLSIVAGNGERGVADGPARTARFSDPFGLAIDGRGRLYVADGGLSNRIRRIDREGRTTTLPGAFDTPSGVAVDGKGNVYVADTGANLIRRIGRDGALSVLAGDGVAGFRDGPPRQARFNGPIGVAVDDSGAVYVADTYNDRIRRISPEGQVSTLAGGPLAGFADGAGPAAAFHTPTSLALLPGGDLVIADTGNDAIRRLGRDGAVSTLARPAPEDRQSPLRAPVGVATTRDGHVYVACLWSGRILQLSPAGELRILVGPGAAVPANGALVLTRPIGLAVDRSGSLYVAEAGRYAVRKLARRRADAPADPATSEIAPSPPALLHASAVPWPVSPQWGWHEVVGDMGEVRGGRGDSRDHLHAGVDIRADLGATVFASADEKVQSPLPVRQLNGLGESLQIDQLTYIHMRVGRTPAGAPLGPRFQLLRDPAGKLVGVRIKRGTRFRVGDPLGTVNGMAHVHLELGARSGDANPIALRFPGLSDHVPPRILRIELRDAAGRPLTARASGRLLVPRSGPLSIVVEATDQLDGNAPRWRLGLYRAGFQILDAKGRPVRGFERPRINLEFDRLPREPDAAKIVYAEESGDTGHGAAQTRLIYVVTNQARGGRVATGDWRPQELPPGDYTVRIYAADFWGNEATEGRDLAISVR